MSDFDKAKEMLREFKGDRYIFGSGVLDRIGGVTAELGSRAALVYTVFPGNDVLGLLQRNIRFQDLLHRGVGQTREVGLDACRRVGIGGLVRLAEVLGLLLELL